MATLGKLFIGTVTSDKMKGTIVVEFKSHRRHPKYQKIIETNTKIYVDNNLNAVCGDVVQVKETRPLSRLKRFTTVQIIKKQENVI